MSAIISASESSSASATVAAVSNEPMHINVNDLTFGYVGREPVLRSMKVQLTNGARCLLIGANGAGKSTILRILGGRHLTKV